MQLYNQWSQTSHRHSCVCIYFMASSNDAEKESKNLSAVSKALAASNTTLHVSKLPQSNELQPIPTALIFPERFKFNKALSPPLWLSMNWFRCSVLPPVDQSVPARRPAPPTHDPSHPGICMSENTSSDIKREDSLCPSYKITLR